MSDNQQVFFDSSLPIFLQAIISSLGEGSLARGLIVRDTSGRLRFLSAATSPTDEVREELRERLCSALGGYARKDGAIAFGDEPGVRTLLKDPAILPMRSGPFEYRLLDRRIVGSAWLDRPLTGSLGPVRIVFASLKGGVGRSTALAITASDLSRRSKNVLVIDLDLEAPGIGDMLLPEERLPNFGTLDYLVENGLAPISEASLSDFIGTSPLTSPTGGRVDVLPAFGRQALNNPANTLAKISRAVLEDIDENGELLSVSKQINAMIARMTQRESYDVVLIDTRAGLAEITAPAVLGLGATVLLFGTAQQQTIHGYEALFAGLKLLADRDSAAGSSADWRFLFKAVYAKYGNNRDLAARYRDDLYDLFAENLYDEDDALQVDPDAFSFDIDDETAPHWPLVIPFSQNLIDFEPVLTPNQLTEDFYELTYRPFLNGIDSILSFDTSKAHEMSGQS